MEILTIQLIKELLSISSTPCLSLYMTTHRSHPENLQDPIRFQNLVKQLEESLLEQYSAIEVKKFLNHSRRLVMTRNSGIIHWRDLLFSVRLNISKL